MDSRCRDDRSVGGISQSIAQCGDLGGNLDGERHNLKQRSGLKLAKDYVGAAIALMVSVPETDGDFEQADCTEADRFSSAVCQAQNTALFLRQFSWLHQPAYCNMRVQQKSRRHRASQIFANTFPKIRRIFIRYITDDADPASQAAF